MLKKFFSNLLSSFMGAWLALVLFGIVAVVVIVGLVIKSGISSEESVAISKKSVLVLNLDGEIVETETNEQLDYLSVMQGNIERPQTLQGITTALKEGVNNKNIKGLYIKCNGVSAAPATLNAIRNAVLEFKKEKPVYAYADNYTTADYYVASVADSIFVNPAGEMALKGITGGTPYLKGLFDKLGVSFQVVKVGTFKSAVEPYTMSEMSEPARAQLDTLYGNMWSYMRNNISESRKKVTPAQLQDAINNKMIAYAPVQEALKMGLVDKLVYRREMSDVLARLSGRDADDLNLVQISDMLTQSDWGTDYNSKNKIAVLYATGEIYDEGSNGIIGNTMAPLIVKLADDDKVKAMVLRVNSPGGSAFASEQIGEALDYFKSKGKTLCVSMGDYAASGGYWISCGADRIYADALTVTGSIGIFGLIPNVKKLTSDVGVNMQWVSTTPEANFPNLFEPLSENQLATMQQYVERGYDTFIERVSTGRHMSKNEVRRIAEGRVWDAQTAKKIGLVDEIGGLNDAIVWTAEKSKLKDNYDIAVYPQLKPTIWDIFSNATSEMAAKQAMQQVGPVYNVEMIQKAIMIVRRKPIQALMPEIQFVY